MRSCQLTRQCCVWLRGRGKVESQSENQIPFLIYLPSLIKVLKVRTKHTAIMRWTMLRPRCALCGVSHLDCCLSVCVGLRACDVDSEADEARSPRLPDVRVDVEGRPARGAGPPDPAAVGAQDRRLRGAVPRRAARKGQKHRRYSARNVFQVALQRSHGVARRGMLFFLQIHSSHPHVSHLPLHAR
jgi:hypothetical protein